MTLDRELISIRAARRPDAPAILTMLADLASFEGAEQSPRLDAATLERDASGPAPRCNILVAEQIGPDQCRQLAGFLSWFENYSSWEGRAGIHIGDLWVGTAFRAQGVGSALLQHVLSRHIGKRVDVFVIRGNKEARIFYERIGFKQQDQWCLYRIDAND